VVQLLDFTSSEVLKREEEKKKKEKNPREKRHGKGEGKRAKNGLACLLSV